MKTRARSLRYSLPLALLAAVGLPLAATGSVASAAGHPMAVLPATVANPPSAACATTADLYAALGTMTTLPGLASLPVLGYNTDGSAITAPGGPTLVACAGTTLTVTLHNNTAETTSLLFQGLAMPPDRAGTAAGTIKTYALNNLPAGTYLYEAGLTPNSQHQVAMGLYGALVVRPAVATQAYDDAATAFNEEAVVLTSEIDPKLNSSATPATFDMRTYKPTYSLVNGDAYPIGNVIPTAAGHTVLLRYVNAGILPHSMGVLGLYDQKLIANDGSPYLDPRHVVAETFGPGQTSDVLTTIPAASATGSKFALYDASLSLNNGATTGLGGMLTFLSVGASTAAGPTAAVNTIATAGSPVTSITGFNATVTASATGGAITEAHYYVDSLSSPAVTVTTVPTSGVAFDVTLATAITSPGVHTIYVQASDANGLGTIAQLSATIPPPTVTDTGKPTTTNAAVNPAATIGSATSTVTVTAQANDVGTGGSDIASATYAIDGGATTTMTVTTSGTATANLQAVIPASVVSGLTEGAHTVSVLSTDTAGNTSATASSATLTVDRTGAATGTVSASKNPTNGVIGFDPNTASVRVTATATDTLSSVGGAEGFIDSVGALGTGFQFNPADGFFNSLSEGVRADIPLTTIKQLADGNHTVYVRSKDALGNWGPTSAVVLIVDKVAPVITNFTPATTTVGFNAAGSTPYTVTATDTGGTGVTGGQYWIDGSATPPASPTAFSGTFTVTTVGLTGGTHTVYARVVDLAGNYSVVKTATLYVVLAVADSQTAAASTGTGAQQINSTGTSGVLTNDQPTGVALRAAKLITAVAKTGGNTTGTYTLTCATGGGTSVVGTSTICTSGSYRLTLSVPASANTAALRAAARRGTYTFSYAEILNGVQSNTVTVTITVT